MSFKEFLTEATIKDLKPLVLKKGQRIPVLGTFISKELEKFSKRTVPIVKERIEKQLLGRKVLVIKDASKIIATGTLSKIQWGPGFSNSVLSVISITLKNGINKTNKKPISKINVDYDRVSITFKS